MCRPKIKKFGFIPAEKKMYLTIWILAHPETFMAAGDRFGVSHSTAHYVYVEIISILNSFLREFITFPDYAKRIKTASVSKFIFKIYLKLYDVSF